MGSSPHIGRSRSGRNYWRGFIQAEGSVAGASAKKSRSGSSTGALERAPRFCFAGAILSEVMASGADLIRNVKQQIDEIDPKDVHENGNGAVIVDVREQHEFEESQLPGAVHVPRGHLESRVEGLVPDRSGRVILYCASGNRSALAAHTMQELLGYEDVASMRGGITLWKDRGYEVEVPRALTPEQRERYSRHLLIPE